MPTQTAEQRQNALNAAGYNPAQQGAVLAGQQTTQPTAISISNLNEPQKALSVPTVPPPRDFGGITAANLESLLSAFTAPTQQEGTQNDLQSRILAQMNTLSGQSARKTQLEGEQNLPGQRQELQNYLNQLQALQKEQQAIPLQIQEEVKGIGATAGGIAPEVTGRLRQNAIKSLSIAAAAQTLQGNISLAETNIQNALEAEFQPERDKLDVLKQLYEFNKADLERVDKKRADTLNVLLNERSRLLQIQEADKKEIYDIGMLAARYGASVSTVNKIMSSSSRGEAVGNASGYLVDPKAQDEIESIRLNNKLKKIEIERAQKEYELLGEPTQKEKEETAKAIKDAKASIPILQDKIASVELLKNHPGLSSAVGPNFAARLGIIAPLSGATQEFAGGVHKLVNGLTLDNLISAKARGAAFGALSEGELKILASSATAISDWELKDKDGNGKGRWNIDEASFKREMDTISDLLRRDMLASGRSIFSADELSVLDEIAPSEDSIDPSQYFGGN